MIGLKRGTVALFPHESAWEQEAERTVNLLKSILGESAADIRHVGSTAVKSIAAKPIIDIAVGAHSLDEILKYKDNLQKNGFFYRETELPGQLLFACGSYYDGSGELQTHFIHIVRYGSREWLDYINFADYLNANPVAARAYEALKLRLALECPVDRGREHYTAGKYEFIRSVLRKALVKSYLGKTVTIGIDRPLGYVHKKEGYELVYPINYGYIPGVLSDDGEELDVYLLGVDEPVKEYTCRIIGIAYRKNDVEDKLIAAPEGVSFTADEMYEQIRFQEQYYETQIETAAEAE